MLRYNAEAIGSYAGVIGAVLLAGNTPWSWVAYALFLVSSVSLVAFSYQRGYSKLLTMQAIFTIINVVGLYNYF